MKSVYEDPEELRRKVLGLGDNSMRKSHYPSLRQRLGELERFRSLVDLSSDLLFVVEYPAGRIIDVSAAASRRLGMERDALLASSFTDLVTAQTWKELLQLFERLRTGDDPDRMVTTELAWDGNPERLPVEIAVQVLPHGERDIAILAARDVAERLKAEQQILKLNRLYAVITQVNKAIVKIEDRDSLFREICRLSVEWGQFRTAWIGLFEDNMLRPVVFAGTPGIAMKGYFAPEAPCVTAVREGKHFVCNELVSECQLIECQRDAISSGSYSSCAVPLKLRGEPIGALALYSSESHFFDDEEIELLDGVASDISFALDAMDREEQRTRIEHAEAENRRKIEATFDASPLAIVVLNNDGMVTAWNRAATEIFGWSQEEALGTSLPVVPEHLRAEHTHLRTLEHVSGHETKRQRKDGSVVDVSLSIAALRSAEAGIAGSVVLYADITAHKQLESELLQAQKLESIGRLAGGIAHDFNNVLAVINGHCELALSRLPHDHPVGGNIREIYKSGQHAANLTRQLLAFGRKQVLQPQVLALNSVIEDMDSMLRTLTGDPVKLVAVLDPAVGGVKVDRGQLQQVIMNLVLNARDAIRASGTVTVRTGNVTLHRREIGNLGDITPGEYVTITVTDDGIGMDMSIQSHIFEPFFTTKQSGKGTGLGLATVWGIVKQSGGFLRVSSAPNQGTTFTIYLPRVEEASASELESARSEMYLCGTETLLIVEDQTDLRELMPEILKRFGYRVLQAADPAEALSLWQQHGDSIRLVITDVVMPGMTGPQLGERIKQMRPDVKMLYMSGHASETVLTETTLAQDAAFIEKPFSAARLAATIRQLLGSREAFLRTA